MKKAYNFVAYAIEQISFPHMSVDDDSGHGHSPVPAMRQPLVVPSLGPYSKLNTWIGIRHPLDLDVQDKWVAVDVGVGLVQARPMRMSYTLSKPIIDQVEVILAQN